ncbi:MAG: polysaccharide deacetylase, partial [Pseudomonadota bacterium]
VTGDADRGQTAEAIARVVLKKTLPGSIIICHANGRNPSTAKALPLFIDTLRDRGYVFVNVSELLSLGRAVAERECYELKPGDNRHYGRKLRKSP